MSSIYASNLDLLKFELLSEAYFGKTETLLEIEKQIGIIRSEAVKKYTDINKSEQVQKLNRLFEKQFGMDIFALHVEKNNTINAYTIPVARNFDIAFNEILSKKVTGDKTNGYRFKEGNNLCIICNVYLGLLNYEELTDAEIVAIILHELGHNFADAISKNIEIANKNFVKSYLYFLIFNVITSFGLLLPDSIITYIKNTNKYKKKKESKKRKRPIKGLLTGISASCNDIGDLFYEIFRRLNIFASKSLKISKKTAENKGVPAKVKRSAARQNEVIADRFAGVYGYGPEQASALLKMDKYVTKAENIVEKIPVIGKIANKNFNEAIEDIYRFDCHPQAIQRLNEELKLLKDELAKSDLDPKLKKAIENQIKEIEKIRDKAIEVTKDLPEDQTKRAAFYKYVLEQDPDALDKDLEEEISQAFDDMLEDN